MVKDGSGLHATNEEGFQAYLSGKLGMVCTTIGKRANFEKSANFKVVPLPSLCLTAKPAKVPSLRQLPDVLLQRSGQTESGLGIHQISGVQ